MSKILEPELKKTVINYLFKKKVLQANSTLINEYAIDKHSRRVDLALVKSKKLFAYEIKSNSDTLLRLHGQISTYLQFFDKVTVITSPKHTQKALLTTPDNVAIWEVNDDDIKVIRAGKIKLISDKYNFLKLITVTELARLAREHNIFVNLKRRKTLEQNLIYLPTSVIREYALNCISERYKKNNQRFFNNLNRSQLATTEDLKLLRTDTNIEINKRKSSNINSLINVLESIQGHES